MKPVTLRFVLEALGLPPCGMNPDTPISDICIDSRAAKDGCLFVPIRGERFDGHDFIPAAFAAGAAAALSEKETRGFDSRPVLRVNSTLGALQALARAYRSLFPIPFVCVTGSVGKTTTKELICSVLSQKYPTLKTQGNLNNQTGVPLSLLRLEDSHQAAVIEMGTNHFGEIDSLAKMVQPDVCVLTNIGESHMEYFGSKEGILRAKSEMFAHMQAGGRIILNGDDPLLFALREKYANVTTYGLGAQNDVRAEEIRSLGLGGTDFTARFSGRMLPLHIPAPGPHMVLNALCALAVGLALGVSDEEAKEGIAAFTSVPGRMDIIKTRTLTLLSDAYNASPTSMRASIDVATGASGRSVLILGDMFELGENAPTFHYALGEYCAQKRAGLVLTVGRLSEELHRGARANGANALHFADKAALISSLQDILRPGDTVLVKASHGMHLEEVCAYIAEHF